MTLRLCSGDNCKRRGSCERYTREPENMAEFKDMMMTEAMLPFDGCELFEKNEGGYQC